MEKWVSNTICIWLREKKIQNRIHVEQYLFVSAPIAPPYALMYTAAWNGEETWKGRLQESKDRSSLQLGFSTVLCFWIPPVPIIHYTSQFASQDVVLLLYTMLCNLHPWMLLAAPFSWPCCWFSITSFSTLPLCCQWKCKAFAVAKRTVVLHWNKAVVNHELVPVTILTDYKEHHPLLSIISPDSNTYTGHSTTAVIILLLHTRYWQSILSKSYKA